MSSTSSANEEAKGEPRRAARETSGEDEGEFKKRNALARGARAFVETTVTSTNAALWWTCAMSALSALCGAPFAWNGLDAAQRFFGQAEPATREYLSMSMWCMVMYVQETLETLMVIAFGSPSVKSRWVYRCSVVNFMRLGLLIFEGSQGYGLGRRNAVLVNFHRRNGVTISIVFAWIYQHTIAAGVPRGRNFLAPRSIPHWVMLFQWSLLFIYGLTFAYTDAVQLYYFKIGTSSEYAVVNWLALGVWQCIISGAVAMWAFPLELQAIYCGVHIVLEFLAMSVMVWQEHKYTLFVDGIVQHQWANHLAMKLALLMTWVYGVYGGLGRQTNGNKQHSS